MRRFPDRLPAGDISAVLGVKASTLSNYLSHLMQVGPRHAGAVGTSLLYAPDMDAMRGTFGYLWQRLLPRPARPVPALRNPPNRSRRHDARDLPRPVHLHRQLGAVDLCRNAPAGRSAAGGSTSIRPERGRNPS
jgi:hypothetical protein